MRHLDPDLVLRLRWLLETHCRGRVNARRGPVLMRALGILCRYPCRRLRSIGEAVDAIRDEVVICSTSAAGYYVATEPEDIESCIAEQEKRARASLRLRGRLKMRLREIRGQRALGQGEAS